MPNDEGRDAVVVVVVAVEDRVADKPLAEMVDVSVTSDAGESLVVVLEPNEGRLAGGGRGGFRAAGFFDLSPDGARFLVGIPLAPPPIEALNAAELLETSDPSLAANPDVAAELLRASTSTWSSTAGTGTELPSSDILLFFKGETRNRPPLEALFDEVPVGSDAETSEAEPAEKVDNRLLAIEAARDNF